MTIQDFIQIFLFLGLLIILTPILGRYMHQVFTGEKHFMLSVLGWLERLAYKFAGVNPEAESSWKSYTFGLLIFNLIGFVFVYLIQFFQSHLPHES